jgi:hypothetical protein
LLPGLPDAAPLDGAVLFAFDDYAFPFQRQAQVHLTYARNPVLAVPCGPPGSHDEQAVFYGAACKIGDVFRYFPDDWGFTTAVNLCESIMPSPSEKGNRILIPTTAITAFPRPAGAFG